MRQRETNAEGEAKATANAVEAAVEARKKEEEDGVQHRGIRFTQEEEAALESLLRSTMQQRKKRPLQRQRKADDDTGDVPNADDVGTFVGPPVPGYMGYPVPRDGRCCCWAAAAFIGPTHCH